MTDPVTCLLEPGHLEVAHTWFLARTHGPDSLRPDSHPYGAHGPSGLQSVEEL